jgi:hypothetical protein
VRGARSHRREENLDPRYRTGKEPIGVNKGVRGVRDSNARSLGAGCRSAKWAVLYQRRLDQYMSHSHWMQGVVVCYRPVKWVRHVWVANMFFVTLEIPLYAVTKPSLCSPCSQVYRL